MDSLKAWLEVSVFGLTLFVMLVGLLGLAVPVFPGMVVIWLAALGYGVVAGFSPSGIGIFVLITLAMIAGTTVDNVLMSAGARQGGAAWRSIVAGGVAGVVGTLLLPPVGGLIAAPLMVLLFEYRRGRDWQKAWRATRGLALGWGMSFLIRFGIGLFIIGLWLVWALWK